MNYFQSEDMIKLIKRMIEQLERIEQVVDELTAEIKKSNKGD